jgi:hypothetical protein
VSIHAGRAGWLAQFRQMTKIACPRNWPASGGSTWVSTGAALALVQLARHDGVAQRDVLERLILAADKRITSRLDPSSLAWSEYMRVTP